MKLIDSRRLTGRNLLWDQPGAVIDAQLFADEAEAAIAAWRAEARRILDAVGWHGEQVCVRRFSSGASFAISAPVDALYAATAVNEWAWEAAEARLAGRPAPPLEEGAGRLRAAIRRESRPALLALRAAARGHGVCFLADDDHVSVGQGRGSRTWPTSRLPEPGSLDWGAIHDIPVALVTGTNGKTTTVRLLAAILEAAGTLTGTTSTDGVSVAHETTARGDFSGPGGARLLLRDQRIGAAVLETARGGILRRGLAVEESDAAGVTNIAADHLGEFGVDGLDALAETKLVVTRTVRAGGRAVLNADDPEVERRGTRGASPVAWFSLAPPTPPAEDGGVPASEASPGPRRLARHVAAGGDACWLEGEEIVLAAGGRREAVASVGQVPVAFHGAARYNVANALAATALAAALGAPPSAIGEGLLRLRNDPEDNPGRGYLLEARAVRVLVDYAHNPHGLAALLDLAATLPARRRLIVLGQAGDRDEEAIRELVRAAWPLRPDRVIVKELPTMLRGRLPGEVPSILEDELRRLGAPLRAMSRAATEVDAVRQALDWARPGDLLVLLIHKQRDDVLALLQEWRAR